jgi:protocatechuate 3,4-dioxygenase alpha subunit
VIVFARGLLKHLFTRLYFADDPANAGDAALALVPEPRRGTLVARQAGDGAWHMDIRLQGEGETVFFDL